MGDDRVSLHLYQAQQTLGFIARKTKEHSMKFTHTHKPTGRPCAIVSQTAFTAVINLGESASNPFSRVDLGDLAQIEPTAAQEAIANADAHLSNAVLPTYTELLAALRDIQLAAVRQQASGGDLMDFQDALRRCADKARPLTARHDKTTAGNFGA
jgi:hypothetical protein